MAVMQLADKAVAANIRASVTNRIRERHVLGAVHKAPLLSEPSVYRLVK